MRKPTKRRGNFHALQSKQLIQHLISLLSNKGLLPLSLEAVIALSDTSEPNLTPNVLRRLRRKKSDKSLYRCAVAHLWFCDGANGQAVVTEAAVVAVATVGEEVVRAVAAVGTDRTRPVVAARALTVEAPVAGARSREKDAVSIRASYQIPLMRRVPSPSTLIY